MKTLRVTETFFSLQGESSLVGKPTFFIRLTGCPLRCTYCDTAYAFQGGERLAIDTLVQRALASGTRYTCVTGGEPLAQADCHELLVHLCNAGQIVSLETSGAVPVEQVDPRVIKVLDIKTPASGEMDKNLWQNLAHLTAQDQVKFVIADRRDYEWSKDVLMHYLLQEKVSDVLFSPVAGQMLPEQLAQWVLQDALPVRFQLQLHKVIWGNRSGV